MAGLFQINQTQPIAHAILVLCSVAASGLALGSLKYRGIALGSAGVLFSGIVFGHFGESIDHDVLDFVKEFGLVLFVFTIGLQLGPVIIAALRQQGLKLNLLSGAIVLSGALIAIAGAKVLKMDVAAVPGLFAGATTNTPSLSAAQQVLDGLPDFPAGSAELSSLAYAVAYPAGIAGIIGSLLILRALFRIDPAREAEEFRAEQQRGVEPMERRNLVVENRSIDGLALSQLPGRGSLGVAVSRVQKSGTGEIHAATENMTVHCGDILVAVGLLPALEEFTRLVGRVSDVDLITQPGKVVSERVVVTRKAILGKTLRALGLEQLYGVTVTRVIRGDLQMSAAADLRLRFGDVMQIVGEAEGIGQAARELGNSTKALSETQFIPLFLGIAMGITVGLIPISFPGLPVPVRLGLAGGPLIVGMVLSRLGHLGRLVWHIPTSTNLAFRELGITLFLAAVGLKAGEKFFATVLSSTGVYWLACAICTTMIPLIAVGIFARRVLKMNYTTISGMIAGSTTDPPALAFAGLMAKSEGPYVAYATVYPMTMLLRILAAQSIALMLCR